MRGSSLYFRSPPALSQVVIEARRITSVSYVIRPPEPWGRSVEIPVVVGFVLACTGARALAIEIKVRGWWGFVASPIDLIVVLGLLALPAWLSLWSFERNDGWWQVLASAGIVVSMVALAVLVIVVALRSLLEHPDALIE